jgi:hypothetical protein
MRAIDRTWRKEKHWKAAVEAGVGAGTGLDWAGFSAKLDTEIGRKYALTKEERREESETVTVQVSSASAVRFTQTREGFR